MDNFKKVVIVHHTYTQTSLVEEKLRGYLLGKVEKLIYITHPFKQARDNLPLNTVVETYGRDGKLKEKKKLLAGIGPEILFYLKDIFLTLFLLLKEAEQIDIYFGVSNLNAFTGLILKKLGKVKKVVYYVIDYVPQRFENPILNKIYHFLDFYCVVNCDQTWNLAEEMAKARLDDGLPDKYLKKQITVPVGCHPAKKFTSKPSFTKEKRIVFLGILSKEQGVDLLIESMAKVIKRINNIKLIIIGSGMLMGYLKNRVNKLNLSSFVEFKGYVKDEDEVDKILQSCHLGLAPYVLEEQSFKHFTDPGKIKTYLGAGLPIMMTNISPIASVIRNQNAGLVIEDTKKAISESIIKILSDRNLYNKLQGNSIILARSYQWKKIFTKAFKLLRKT